MAELFRSTSRPAANEIAGYLSDAGIPHTINTEAELLGIMGVSGSGTQHVVIVPDELLEQARQAIDNIADYDDAELDKADLVCPSCGYALKGLPRKGDCPECGKAYDKVKVFLGR